ncbi:MAG: APC family permease [Actinobacteria bacterium]|nr:APC family permease [Actinomycetota bacterium]
MTTPPAPGLLARVKRILLGRPFATSDEDHHLLPKRLALPLFASDPLSSVAYATEEIMLVLALAGAAAFTHMIPIAAAIALLVVVVVTSYRQTVRAYPQGGGAYLVTRDNLGAIPARVAASALMIDYVLTVAVSVTAGVAAITSAFPSVLPERVWIAMAFVAFLGLVNLRGVRETGRLFAVPTYFFFVMVMAVLATGFARCLGGTCPAAETASVAIEPELGAVGVLLIMRAFASGSTALTGIEAIADGVPAFRRPKAGNAAATLAIMATMSITMFLGITSLSLLFDVRVSEATVDTYGSVLSQVGRTAFGGEGVLFFALQAATMGILVLAANTAYQDFPRLSAILAGDRLMPRQLRNRGDRLVYSNGIVVLSLMAAALIVAFDATLSRLIQLYVVGVFVSFTLSQTSMVRRWWKLRTGRWRRSMAINAVGATTTGVVLVVVATAKFAKGAWAVVAAIPLLVLAMSRVNRHYEWVATQLSLFRERRRPPLRTEVIVLASHVSQGTRRALAYADTLGADRVQCVHVEEGPRDSFWLDWQAPNADIPLTVLRPRRRGVVRPLRAFISDIRWEHPRTRVVVVIPEWQSEPRWLWRLLHHRASRIKAGLIGMRDVVMVNIVLSPRPLLRGRGTPPPPPTERIAVVPVGGVTQATLDTIAYVRWTDPVALHPVHVELEPEYAERTQEEWARYYPDVPLEIVANPFRATVPVILDYIRRIRAEAPPGRVVEVVIPEFVVPGRMGRALHNKTARSLRARLARDPDIITTTVPWLLKDEAEAYSAREV